MAILILVLIAQVPGGLEYGQLSSTSVVINEFMAEPLSSFTEHDGEFVELYNTTGGWINLSGWMLENASGQKIQLNTYLIPPESYCVLAACGNQNLNGGFTADYVYGSFDIESTGRLVLYNGAHEQVDRVEYDAGWPVQPGASCERINPGWISSTPSSWDCALSVFGSGDRGTPGLQNSVYQNSFTQNSWAFIKAFVE
mgnify:CR=1 FL=1